MPRKKKERVERLSLDLRARRLTGDGGECWFATSAARGAAAESIAQGRDWWQGLVDLLKAPGANHIQKLSYERRAIAQMWRV